jgi:hypothetical protein
MASSVSNAVKKVFRMAIDSLYPYTDFQKISYKLSLRRLKGTIKPKEEEKLRQLGLKI